MQPPPPILRIIAKGDVPPGPRLRPSGAIQPGAEAPTLGTYDPSRQQESTTTRSTWIITGVLVATGALLGVLILRALHSH